MVDYLLSITQPLFSFTNEVSKSRDITIHTVFDIYYALFAHLEKSTKQLMRKKKMFMLRALKHTSKKLSQYFEATDNVGNDLYAITTIMAPQNKMEIIQKPETHAYATPMSKRRTGCLLGTRPCKLWLALLACCNFNYS
ncbi:uncharacterized protein N7443_000225 [Penicillium atrosanguineum]|uniref:uncharacterized protein n=1 Tax=Penicillium atrosanguineum TaxID=1132637 RepID=UPI002383CDA5|nr:uncharacterized protein N7443_000225 [Penicillium atrosanguineum]KAJ5313341.1 hypothetical protein N7443_000225 [Penicillium atrosanguineum]